MAREDVYSALSEEWFRKHGFEDPVIANDRWRRWLTRHGGNDDDAKYRKVLEIATRLGESAIRHYLNSPWKLGAWTRLVLDDLTEALGVPLPESARRRPKPTPPKSGGRRIALLTGLAELPSPSYHLEVIGSIIHAAQQRNQAVAVHEAAPGELTETVKHVLRVCQPDAVIMLRLTPAREACNLLADYGVPAVLVHADRYSYPCPPVLANVAPRQDGIVDALWKWLEDHLGPSDPRSGAGDPANRPVMVAMPREPAGQEYRLLPGIDPSIRNERIDLMSRVVVTVFGGTVESAPDYSFRHARGVFAKHPRASAYVCLSDPLAVAMRHLAATAGREDVPVIGFDDSALARRENLPSFGQALPQIGITVAELLTAWFGRPGDADERTWPKFQHIPTDVRLITPEQRRIPE